MPQRPVITCLLLFGLTATTAVTRGAARTALVPDREDAADAARLIEVLDVGQGSTVAEIGAGEGALTLAMAEHVGRSGRVYSSELGPERVADLRQAVAKADLENVTVLEGHANQTNLPDKCCDALFMRRVYHHFEDPGAMNASLWRSLKPGGRLAIIDFPPDTGESAEPSGRSDGDQHGVTAQTVERELKEAAFEVLSTDKVSDRDFMVVVQKPTMR
ncbi:MAG: methyltransferase domain-containing protein [Luteitalea sp.]|nr:methyltransferase domain-containing protein [Luteitalea sp.]